MTNGKTHSTPVVPLDDLRDAVADGTVPADREEYLNTFGLVEAIVHDARKVAHCTWSVTPPADVDEAVEATLRIRDNLCELFGIEERDL